jgi:hypothetical protein
VQHQRGRARARAVLEENDAHEPHLVEQRHRLLEVLVGLAREAHDHVGGQDQIGARVAQRRHDPRYRSRV